MYLNNLGKTGGVIARRVANAGELRMTAWGCLSLFCCFWKRNLCFVLFSFSLLFLIVMLAVLLHPEPASAKERLKWMICSSFSLQLGASDKMNSSNREIVQFIVTCSPGGTFEANRTIKDGRVSEVVFPEDFIDKITGSKGSEGTGCYQNRDFTWRIVVGGKVIDSGKIKQICR